MITQSQIKRETEELKDILLSSEIEVPSMWLCVWPGLLFAVWFFMCFYISSIFSSGLRGRDVEFSLIFCLIMGLVVIMATSNARALFLSVPKHFRDKSVLYNELGGKMKIYMIFGLGISFLSSIACGVFDMSWPVVLFVLIMLFFLCMTIDFSRYQLAAFSNVISAFKDSKNA
ncbi:hypothetical protein I6G97_00040 (plasmid) [Edwardsiella hoshinae]|uniref:Conjugal transfer entry exclusion protein TraS n=1 Tax=Edwardsiella hoshinae TaxID=93378 RepID=A0A376IXZ1_9GAMM|nr:hypothetical protein [Edwardsiella hoshinae]QPR26588.1 hypothetical protein I6G97_00040 [Edwardsiella hoshinae]STE53256.1 conjugal transfer entry exclusion protein TraS [Edwardsiella hoshinae]